MVDEDELSPLSKAAAKVFGEEAGFAFDSDEEFAASSKWLGTHEESRRAKTSRDLELETEKNTLERELREKEKDLEELRIVVKRQEEELLRTQQQQQHQRLVAESYEDDEELDEYFRWDDDERGPRHLNLDDSKAFRQLSELDLSNHGVCEEDLGSVLKILEDCETISAVNLSDNGLTDDSAPDIAQIVANGRIHLHTLNLRRNSFLCKGAEIILNSLAKNVSLSMIDMSENPFADDPQAGRILGESLGSVPSELEEVRISIGDPRQERTSMTRRGNSSTFVTGILQNPHSRIRKLALMQRTLPKCTVALIAFEGIKKHRLQELDLRMSFVGSVGAVIIAKAMLASCCVVEKLNLKMNAIGHRGCVWLAKAIAASNSLTEVDLSSNELGDLSAKVLGDALQESTSHLRLLDVTGNNFFDATQTTEVGAMNFVRGVAAQRKLVSLGNSNYLRFSSKVKQKLLSILDQYQTEQPKGAEKAEWDRGSLTIFEQQKKIALARLLQASNENSVDICDICIPPIGDAGAFFGITTDWQADVEIQWRILRECQGRRRGLEVVSSGTSMEAENLQRKWIRFHVVTDDWRCGNRLVLECRLKSKKDTWTSAHIQGISVRVDRFERQNLEEKMEPQKTQHHQRFRREIQRKDWEVDAFVNLGTKNTTSPFFKFFDFYIHSRIHRGLMKMEFCVRIEEFGTDLPIRDRRKAVRQLLGTEWKISRADDPTVAIRGNGDKGRSLLNEEERAMITFSVDLSNLQFDLGNTISLWLRLPNVLIAKPRVRNEIYKICCFKATLVQEILDSQFLHPDERAQLEEEPAFSLF